MQHEVESGAQPVDVPSGDAHPVITAGRARLFLKPLLLLDRLGSGLDGNNLEEIVLDVALDLDPLADEGVGGIL